MPADTPNQRLASLLLKQPLDAYIATSRAAGKSWRRISLDLAADTDGQVEVTPEAIRGWAITLGVEPETASA